LTVIAIQKISETAEDGSFFLPASAGAWDGGDDPVRQAAERQRLQPHAAGSPQRGEEQAFAAEQSRLDLAHVLDLVIDGRLKPDDAAGVDADDFSGGQRPFQQRATGVNKRPAVPLQTLHDESLAAEQADAEPPLERDADAHTLRGGEK